MALSEGLELFIESVPDAMLIANEAGEILLTNKLLLDMFGYGEGQLVGQSVEVLMPECRRAGHRGLREGYVRAPRARSMAGDLELRAVRRSGEQFPVEISLSPIAHDGVVLVSSAVRDVSGRLERERRARANELELQKLAAVNRFLFSLSHELRTPLNAISGFSATLLMGLSGPLAQEQERHLGLIENSANHLLDLINQLLSLMKPNYQTENLDVESVDPFESLERAVGMLEPRASGKGLTIELVRESPVAEIRTSRAMCSQILINLIDNAVKYTDTGKITVTMKDCGDPKEPRLAFEVADTGIGITTEAQQYLFEMFYRSKRDRDGCGIGLFIAQQLANRLGGAITFSSRYGRGSTFILSLPVNGMQHVSQISGH